MAKKTTPVKAKPRRLLGADKVVGIFADAYLIAHSGSAYSLYFFQSQFESPAVGGGDSIRLQSTDFTCVARIALSESSFDKLLKAMQDNREATRQAKAKSKTE